MAMNQLPSILMYLDCDHFVDSVGIQNIFMRKRYQEVFQNFYFTDNTKQDKTDKGYKIKPIINHLNESFQAVFSNDLEQSIDEHMTKFREGSSLRETYNMGI